MSFCNKLHKFYNNIKQIANNIHFKKELEKL
jgi:hypothetical protein